MKTDYSAFIPKETALARLFALWQPKAEAETVSIWDAAGRILAEDQFARYDLPVVRASTRDGVAVKSQRFQDGMPDTSHWQLGVDFIRADTGDDFDDAFDAVIAIEDVELLPGGGIRFPEPVPVREGYQVKGSGRDLKKGSLLAPKGTRLTAQALSAIAMGGITEIPVVRQPRVAFIPTGSELVPPGAALQRGQNFDSNSILACQMLKDMGAVPVLHPIVRDDPAPLQAALEAALSECDIILVNAGTSKGGEDYSCKLLEKNGQVLFHGVAAVPGRPMSAAMVGNIPVVNLSGPSFAAFYSMDWMVRALVCRFLGIPVPVLETVQAILTEDFQTPPFFSLMAPMRLDPQPDGTYLATPLTTRGPKSAGSAASLLADGVYISTPGQPALQAGAAVEIQLLKNRSELGSR
jgi:molybdopterin molybdotransferase/putative molybdopterin biosynthesis protein